MKLTYFNIEGVAEKIRLALKIGRIPFEDERVDMNQWAALKPSTPFGQLPILQIEGRPVMAQSTAILRFIGRVTGLIPLDPYAQFLVDEVLGLQEDISKTLAPSMYIMTRCHMYGYPEDLPEDERRGIQHRIRETLASEKGDLHRLLGHLDSILERSQAGWFAGPSVTVADCAVFPTLRQLRSGKLDGIPVTILDKYPRLVQFYERFLAIPQVQVHYNEAK